MWQVSTPPGPTLQAPIRSPAGGAVLTGMGESGIWVLGVGHRQAADIAPVVDSPCLCPPLRDLPTPELCLG
jgi:hypothetical protein